ncbi:MAG TPA: hypothetical protein VHL11_21600 [Phototrophicaceae bacterium]|nr:hypothetical protein [Phototrophicaceae bacterium]
MHNDGAIIQQYPTAVGGAFGAVRQGLVDFFDFFPNMVSDGFELAVTVTGADDEEIRDNCFGA